MQLTSITFGRFIVQERAKLSTRYEDRKSVVQVQALHCHAMNSMIYFRSAFRCCYCGFHNPARRNRRNPQVLQFPTSPDSPSNQPTPLSTSYERPQYSSALNLTSVGSRSHLNRGPFERISTSTENVLSSSFIESSALPPQSSRRCRTAVATQRNPGSRSTSACSLTTSPLLPEEEGEKDPLEKLEEGES
ncbi:hypothetical protein ACTXT7_007527 [Hymenolepis weldensis]